MLKVISHIDLSIRLLLWIFIFCGLPMSCARTVIAQKTSSKTLERECELPNLVWKVDRKGYDSKSVLKLAKLFEAGMRADYESIKKMDSTQIGLMKSFNSTFANIVQASSVEDYTVSQEFYENYRANRDAICALMVILKNASVTTGAKSKLESLYVDLLKSWAGVRDREEKKLFGAVVSGFRAMPTTLVDGTIFFTINNYNDFNLGLNTDLINIGLVFEFPRIEILQSDDKKEYYIERIDLGEITIANNQEFVTVTDKTFEVEHNSYLPFKISYKIKLNKEQEKKWEYVKNNGIDLPPIDLTFKVEIVYLNRQTNKQQLSDGVCTIRYKN